MKHGYDAPSSSSSSCIMFINIVLSVALTSTSLVLSRAASLLSLETIHSVQQQRRNLQLIGNNHKQINCTHHELSQTTTRATHKHHSSICLFSSSTKVQVNWTNNCNFYQHAFQWSLLAVHVYLRLDWTTLKAGQKRLWITLFPHCVYLQFTNHHQLFHPFVVNTLDHMHEQLDSSLCPLVRELSTSWYKFHQEIVGKFPSDQ